MKRILLLLTITIGLLYAEITFTDINAGLPGAVHVVAWGDYDNDGDLDIFLVKVDEFGNSISKIYRNDGNGVFTDINALLSGGGSGAVAWGDYDNDGDLDLLLTGDTAPHPDFNPISKIYRNDGNGVFTDINAGLPGVRYGSIAWGDYDNDGDLDILLAGDYISKIYRNDGNGVFTDINAGLTGIRFGSIAWGDYDNDGDLDILLTGDTAVHPDFNNPISKIYRNDGNGVFTDINAGLTGVTEGTVSWGDYDNDGDLDILMVGTTIDYWYPISKIYRNDGNGVFTDINAGLTGVIGSAAWGDYDNDGDLDILLTGAIAQPTEHYTISKIYRNDGNGVFTDINAGLTSVRGKVAWGDYDNDGDLDILLVGQNVEMVGISLGQISKIYRNDGAPSNTLPLIPENLASNTHLFHSNLTWDWSNDTETHKDGLTYNLIIEGPEGIVKSPMSRGTDGMRKIVEFGNAGQQNYWNIYDLPPGDYSWRVQAIDNSFAGSAFSTAQHFSVEYPFEKQLISLQGLTNSTVSWGDYDNDGNLDMLVTGYNGTSGITRIYRNNGTGGFDEVSAVIPGVKNGSAEWCDFNNDGYLDFVITGKASTGRIANIFKNNGDGTFSDINAGITGVDYSSCAWFDYDNDGYMDLVIAGDTGSGFITRIYRNDAGSFYDISAGMTGVSNGTVACADYDNDGWTDLLVTGKTGTSSVTMLYRNVQGSFYDVNAGLLALTGSSASFGDYDSDGDLDILISGNNGNTPLTKIYRNDGNGVFTDANAMLHGISGGKVMWADFDNDGNLDIIISGINGSQNITKVYKNKNGFFRDMLNLGLDFVSFGSVACADYNNDGALDILLSGSTESGFVTNLYKNKSPQKNTKPQKPSKLSSRLEDNALIFTYGQGYDDQTQQSGLYYNMSVMINGEIAVPGMSAQSGGGRRIINTGNAGQARSFYLDNFLTYLPQGKKTVQWYVQAIDNSYQGSEFAGQSFISNSPRDLELLCETEMGESDYLMWEYVYPEHVDFYVIQIDDDPLFKTPLEKVYEMDKKSEKKIKSNEESKTLYNFIFINEFDGYETLSNGVTYYWRVKPVYYGINRFTIYSQIPSSFVYKAEGSGSNLPPNPPVTGFNPANDAIASNKPMINWGNANDPDGNAQDLRYTIELDSTSTFGTVLYADTTEVGETYTQLTTALADGYRYYYRVKTIDIGDLESEWSESQTFITIIPPKNVKISDDGLNVNLSWDAVPVNSKNIVYTVYSSSNPYAEFPSGWSVSAAQLTGTSWSEPYTDTKKFYVITVGSSSK